MSLAITGITISADFGDKEYGKGSESFMNMSAKISEPNGTPLKDIDGVILDGIDLYFACWQTLLASRWATGVIPADEFNKRLDATRKRIQKVRKLYEKEIATSEQL
jgi:hypothetical protein